MRAPDTRARSWGRGNAQNGQGEERCHPVQTDCFTKGIGAKLRNRKWWVCEEKLGDINCIKYN